MRTFFFLLFISFSIQSQTLQTPSEFLGYELGTEFSRHHQVLEYFKHVANVKPMQVRLEQYGKTYERRPLYVTYISSEENIKNLETIRINNLKQTGLLSGDSNPNIAIVWLSYNVHGNEASSTEAAMQTLYNLLTKNEDYLKNTVVIIDPCLNPDGRDRYVNWYNETARNKHDIDPQASEHNEPWPSGRPNHYLFDLNRDWAWASQVESSSRLKIYNKWLPHIHVDFHEQGINEPYYFAPAAEPFHEIITPWQRDFQTQIGKNHARYFDKEGWLYFTRERFDLFYPSYGDTYPTYMGSIGMTYEQAGHGRAGLAILNDEDEILTLKDRLTHHTVTGISTVEIASKNAQKLNTEFKKFFNNSSLKYKSYVLKGHKDNIEALTKLLDKHEISYGYTNNGKVNGYNYATTNQGSINTTSNDLVISTSQPKGKMIKALFEPNAKLSDSLTYDITAWSLPYAYGLEAIASTKTVTSNSSKNKTIIENLPDAYGFVCEWKSMKNARFLSALLTRKFNVRFTEKPFTQNGKQFERGSLIITKRDNKHLKDFNGKLNKICQHLKQELIPIYTGFSEMTPDIGSPDIKLINKPKIALLSGKGTSSLSYGAIWHFFEQQLKYPVTHINTNNFGYINLNKYNILILPSGYYSSVLNESNFNKLKNWISKGGKVIAIDAALRSFVNKEDFALNYKNTEKTEDKNILNTQPYASRERNYVKQMITGAIFKTKLDTTHPLAFGYNNSYFTLKLGSSAYSLLDSGYNVCYIEDNLLQVSGFAGKEALKKLSNSLVFAEDTYGSGSVIYMADNVLFRSFWENGKLFFANALFFVNNNAFEL